MTETSQSSDVFTAEALLAIWQKHRSSTLERVGSIERAALALSSDELDEQLRGEAQRAAHTLAGSVGTFGFTDASKAARALESKLAKPGLSDAQSIGTLVAALRRDLEKEAASEVAPKESDASAQRVHEHLKATRALVVDDDRAMLETVRLLLEPHDLEVSTLADPLRFQEVLEQVRPELLILDVDMPGVSGPELCRIVREDTRWSHLAVIFVTASTDAATIEGVFRAGADDYVAKPIVGSELITRVSNRLDRIRLYRSKAETDSLTGLSNRGKAGESLTQLLSLAQRFAQPLSVAMLDLDRFKLINDSHGHAVGDSVLRTLGAQLSQDFRDNDVVGRWGGEEFVVGMYGMSAEDGIRRMQSALERFLLAEFAGHTGAFHASFSAGIAAYPADGQDLASVLGAADQALYRAKRTGRARVLGVDDNELISQCDVVCVEDDQTLVELLLASLSARGYSVRCFGDGEDARTALCGSRPALRCSVLLLDVDLPRLDGFALLDQLACDGVLGFTRVIMLTASAGESDTVKSFELGAFDHVAKPFSLPVLMQRVQKAMLV